MIDFLCAHFLSMNEKYLKTYKHRFMRLHTFNFGKSFNDRNAVFFYSHSINLFYSPVDDLPFFYRNLSTFNRKYLFSKHNIKYIDKF